jgi:hypothetical protein
MTDAIPFLPDTPTDEQLQANARAQGLYVAVDKYGNYYLQLLDPPEFKEEGKMSIDPHLVLAYVKRGDVVAYLRKRHTQHYTLGPAAVLGPVRRGDHREGPEE